MPGAAPRRLAPRVAAGGAGMHFERHRPSPPRLRRL
jgi:hypothetical protein